LHRQEAHGEHHAVRGHLRQDSHLHQRLAPGHSIGHTSFVVASGGSQVFVQGDVNNHFAVFSRNPDWHGWFDQDPVQAAATRRRVYDMLVAEKMPVQAYHHPFPGLGRVEKDGNGYRVLPAA
jgi:glyoxylase-like metal-dependent hydrolase (beta-lactamase superfamily II)